MSWFEEGQILFRKGDHERSIRAFTHAMRAGWDPMISHLSRGVANLLAKHPEKAYGDFTEVIKRDGLNTRALVYRGHASMEMGRFAHAAGDFTHALDIDPDYGLALLNRGFCYARIGRYEDAATDIKRAMMAAETEVQHLADQMGIWRTHIDGVLGVLHEHTDLTDEEIEKLRSCFR